MEPLSRSISQALHESESGPSYDVLMADNDDSFEVTDVSIIDTADEALQEFLKSLPKSVDAPSNSLTIPLDSSRPLHHPVFSDSAASASTSASSGSPLSEKWETASTSQEGTSKGTTINALIKNDLKSKILTRRVSEGKGELKVDFKPPKTYPLTSEEKCKIERRKQRNRYSANQSRLRRIAKEKELLKETDLLESENRKLQEEITALEKRKEELNRALHSHTCKSRPVEHGNCSDGTDLPQSSMPSKPTPLQNQLLCRMNRHLQLQLLALLQGIKSSGVNIQNNDVSRRACESPPGSLHRHSSGAQTAFPLTNNLQTHGSCTLTTSALPNLFQNHGSNTINTGSLMNNKNDNGFQTLGGSLLKKLMQRNVSSTVSSVSNARDVQIYSSDKTTSNDVITSNEFLRKSDHSDFESSASSGSRTSVNSSSVTSIEHFSGNTRGSQGGEALEKSLFQTQGCTGSSSYLATYPHQRDPLQSCDEKSVIFERLRTRMT